MATKKIKKTQKTRPRHVYRNAPNPPRRVLRAATQLANAEEEAQDKKLKKTYDTPGWRMLKALGGATGTTIAGAYLAQQHLLPPKAMTGLLAAIGAVFAANHNDTLQSVGLGVMSAAGGQLGFMLIDDELIKKEEDDAKKQQQQGACMPETGQGSGNDEGGHCQREAAQQQFPCANRAQNCVKGNRQW